MYSPAKDRFGRYGRGESRRLEVDRGVGVPLGLRVAADQPRQELVAALGDLRKPGETPTDQPAVGEVPDQGRERVDAEHVAVDVDVLPLGPRGVRERLVEGEPGAGELLLQPSLPRVRRLDGAVVEDRLQHLPLRRSIEVLLVGAHEVRGGRDRPEVVERVPAVRNGKEQASSLASDLGDLLEPADGIRNVLDHVIRDDDVEALGNRGGESLLLHDVVDVGYALLRSPRIGGVPLAQLLTGKPVEVADVPIRIGRRVHRADLEDRGVPAKGDRGLDEASPSRPDARQPASAPSGTLSSLDSAGAKSASVNTSPSTSRQRSIRT